MGFLFARGSQGDALDAVDAWWKVSLGASSGNIHFVFALISSESIETSHERRGIHGNSKRPETDRPTPRGHDGLSVIPRRTWHSCNDEKRRFAEYRLLDINWSS